jgi:hypothetical protein
VCVLIEHANSTRTLIDGASQHRQSITNTNCGMA